jgi:hypothetical protein
LTPRRPRRLLRTLALASIALLTAAGIAAAASRHSHHRRHARHHAAAHAAGVVAYAALLREPTAADSENAEIVNTARENDSGLRPSAARLLDANANGRTWLIPTDRGELCLGLQPAGQYEEVERRRGLEHLSFAYACGPTATVEAQGLVLRLYDNVVGIVPDGVTSVSVDVGNAAPEREPVLDNTYRFSVADGFHEGQISFQDRSGAEQVDRL